MAKAKSVKDKKPVKGKKEKAKSKSGFTRYMAMLALLTVLIIAGYHFFYKTKKLTAIIKTPLTKIKEIWPSDSDNTPADRSEIHQQSEHKQEKPAKPEKNQKRVISAERLNDFASSITEAAKKTVDLPFKNGGDPSTDRATDNSHLIFYIWEQAASKTGLSIGSYRPMQQLIADCQEIHLSELTNGDLIVLNDGNAGLIYGFSEENDGFYLIYASSNQKKVVSVKSKELKKYWLNQENKKGYYRATTKIFS